MTIKFTNYTDGIHYLDYEEPVAKLNLEEPFLGNLKLNVKMDKSSHQIVLNCSLSVNARLICDRCQEEYQREFRNEFILTYLFAKEDVTSDDLNLYYISPESDKINLHQDIIDFAILAVPMKKLCQEDCKGLCASCGMNLNAEACQCKKDEINPVWEALQKLKKTNNN